MFRLTLFPLLLLCLAQSAPAQCTKKMSDLPAAPELLGFRLGMTKAEVKARAEGYKERALLKKSQHAPKR